MNFQSLKDFLDYYLPMLGVPGSDTVIYKDHKEIFRYTAGCDNLEKRTPLRRDAIYNVYSCTKIATGVAAMQLLEKGEILLSDPVYAYIPEFKNLTVEVKDEAGNVIDLRPAKKPMLIKHLLSMTSGMKYDLQGPGIKRVKEATFGRAPTVQTCAAMAQTPLVAEPGDAYNYGLSLDVMGAIVELVSGKRYADYMKDNIFDPLGMKDTTFHVDESKRDRFATQYLYEPGVNPPKIVPFEENHFRIGTEFDSGGAGIASTVDDYILLMDALANYGVGKNGTRILSSYAVNQMRGNLLNDEQLKTFQTGACQGYGYGCGVRMSLTPESAGNLAPRGEFGWDGWKLCIAMADPENRLAVFHAEHLGGFHSIVIPRFRNLIYSCLDY